MSWGTTLTNDHRPSAGRIVALLTVIMVIGQLLLAAPASAGTEVVPWERWLGHYDVAGTGNTLRTASNSADACAVSNGSSAALTGLPSAGTITAAYLYWVGSHRVSAGFDPDYDVTFQGQSVSADRRYTETFDLDASTSFDWFSGVADVTDIVVTNRNATYDFSDLTVYTGNPHCASSGVVSGWSLIVVYSDDLLPNRAINLYEGFSFERYSSNTYTLSDFTAPDPATGDIVVLTWEGDPGLGTLGDESLTFNGDLVSGGALNPATDPYNSTITFTGNSASHGVDLDRFSVDGSVDPGDTTAQLGFSAGQDLILLSAVVLAVDTFGADLALDKTISDTTPEPGETVTYTLTVTNLGVDDATGVEVADVLPNGVTYLSHVASTGTYVPATGVWNVGSVSAPVEPDPTPGTETLEIEVQVTAALGDIVTNEAEITAADQTDPNSRPGNNNPSEDDQSSISFTVNGPPVAVDDSDSTDEDTPVTVSVLANDSDPEGDPLRVAMTTIPANGSVVINADGTVTYTPAADFFGTDTFDYDVCDIYDECDTATVTVTVVSVNDDPVAVDDSDSTDEDTPVTVSVLANDSDVDGDALAVTGTTDPSNGSIVDHGDGTVTYTPDPNFHGIDSFTYTISDGNGGTDTATVTITVDPVNDDPDAVNDS
ncbi:MAG: tandem-95 repeat protein, partial [Acidimicrobiia bacterium]